MMPMSRISYRFMVLLFVYTLAILIPLSFIVFYDTDMMVHAMEEGAPLTHAQEAIQARGVGKLVDDIISLSFYMAVLAFLVSLFFSRRLFSPLRDLYQSARSLVEGDPDASVSSESMRERCADDFCATFKGLMQSVQRKSASIATKELYLSSMTEPMWVLDEDNAVVEVNDAFTRVFGYPREDVIGALVFDIIDEAGERRLRHRQYDEEVSTAGGQPEPIEVSVISRSEGMVPVLLSETPVMKDGRITGRIGMMTDFRREAALTDAIETEKGYSLALMDSLREQLVVMDRDLRVVRANLAARVAAGGDITAAKCHDIFHAMKDECPLHFEGCPIETVFRTGAPHRCFYELRGGIAGKALAEMSVYPLKNPHTGAVERVVCLLSDVTDRKKFEDEIEKKDRELTALTTISRTLGRSLMAEGVFSEVLDRVIALLGMNGGGIYFIDDTGRELKCQWHRGLSVEFVKTISWIKVGEDIPGAVALSGASLFASDVSADRRTERSSLRHSGIKGYAAVPIRGKERSLGVLFIFSLKPHAFGGDEERLLNSVSEMMGLALENMRLYEKMRSLYEQQRRHRAEEQKNLLDLSGMLSSSVEMKDVLSGCMAIIKSAMKADLVWMLGLSAEGALTLRACTEPIFREGDALYGPEADSIERHAIARRKPVSLNDIVVEDRLQMLPELKGYRFACAIPMFIGDKNYGAFTLYYEMEKRLGEEEMHFLQTVSSVLAVAMERAALYESVILQKGEADAVLESILDGVISASASGVVMAANKAAFRIFEADGRHLVGLGLEEVFGRPAENSELLLNMESGLDDALMGKSGHFEARYVGASGGITPLQIYCWPVSDDRGVIAGVVFVVRDLGMATEVDKMKTDFLRAVSHEFRTPLTAIVGLSEMMLAGEVEGERAQEYLRTIHNEGKRLSNMVSDVLDITRIEGGREVLHPSTVDFSKIFEDLQESYTPAALGRGLNIAFQLQDGAGGFIGDAEKLKQMLRNIIDNSVAYSEAGASIDVSVRMEGGAAVLTVRDTGWGMTSEELAHAGQKFFRGKRAAARTKGTGLGLSICRSLTELQGGEFEIQSAEGEGTTVTVRIPGAMG